MNRFVQPPRVGWEMEVEALGLLFHTHDGTAYWNEGARYEFTLAEIEEIESVTNDLAARCLDAVECVISRRRYKDLEIPSWVIPAIEHSWNADTPSIYGRFDLSYDNHQIKLLEYNADTPTTLLESAVIQWHWLKAFEQDADQFNGIYEALAEKWRALKDEAGALQSHKIHFASLDHPEDLMTTTVLQDTALEAGLEAQHLFLGDIGWDARTRRFVDLEDQPIDVLFKLHPWEILIEDPFGAQAISTYSSTQWIEPAWKMILSNKGILAILHELFPDHPNILPAFADMPNKLGDYVCKPFLSREGANVSVVANGITIAKTEGEYGDSRCVFQERASIPCLDGFYPIIGSWVIDQSSCGIGIRESKELITTDRSHFVPHLIRG